MLLICQLCLCALCDCEFTGISVLKIFILLLNLVFLYAPVIIFTRQLVLRAAFML